MTKTGRTSAVTSGLNRKDYGMERNCKLIPGVVYTNRNGSRYRCKAVKGPACYTMQRITDRWTLDAHNITRYEDGLIEWDYSTGGYWADRFEVWKDCELGKEYLEKRFDTYQEAHEWLEENERHYPGWHLRIVENPWYRRHPGGIEGGKTC